MRFQVMKNNLIPLLLLAVLFMAALQSRAQNQTPANVAPPAVGWTDPATGLTWTKEDNGSRVNWNQATDYCSNLRLGGYTDWRLPTVDELQGIFDRSANGKGEHVKGNLQLSSYYHWSSTQINDGQAWSVTYGERVALGLGGGFWAGSYLRALCVRQ